MMIHSTPCISLQDIAFKFNDVFSLEGAIGCPYDSVIVHSDGNSFSHGTWKFPKSFKKCEGKVKRVLACAPIENSNHQVKTQRRKESLRPEPAK